MIAFRNSFKPNRGNVPAYDADGNVISLKTATGTWQITYNGANRPVTWVKSTGEKIFMMYDSLGRRFEKRVLNAAGRRILRERYVYAGYNCVQILNGDGGNAVEKEFVWDPTEPTGTRPLTWTFVKRGLNLFYAHDGNKNVSDVFFLALQNGVAAHYEYAPFGAITRTAKNTPYTIDLIAANPFRFSSEFYDPELDLIYYNYRHYSPSLGRWLSRDPIEEKGGLNLYAFCKNNGINIWDFLGDVGFPGFSPIAGRNLQCMVDNWLQPQPSGGRCRPSTNGGIECRTNKPSKKEPLLNGCGSEGSEWVPDSFLWIVSFVEACNNHDKCYGTCGSSKEDCDKKLGHDMENACKNKFGILRFVFRKSYLLCLAQAKIYELALLNVSAADAAFEKAQDVACEWEELPCVVN